MIIVIKIKYASKKDDASITIWYMLGLDLDKWFSTNRHGSRQLVLNQVVVDSLMARERDE